MPSITIDCTAQFFADLLAALSDQRAGQIFPRLAGESDGAYVKRFLVTPSKQRVQAYRKARLTVGEQEIS